MKKITIRLIFYFAGDPLDSQCENRILYENEVTESESGKAVLEKRSGEEGVAEAAGKFLHCRLCARNTT